MDHEPKLQRGRRLDDLEQRMSARARKELETLDIFDRATLTLASILEGLNVPFHDGPAPVEVYLRSAILNLGVIAMRTARALRSVVGVGYEPEAHGLKRRLSEAHSRVGAVVDDTSGEHARQWLTGRGPSTPHKIAGKFGSLAMFEIYSESTHATIGGLLAWVAVPMADGTRAMPFAPNRNPAFANALLIEAAAECRDFAMIAAKAFDREALGLGQLDADLLRAHERSYVTDEPTPTDAADR
jgi:hypothetical protein